MLRRRGHVHDGVPADLLLRCGVPPDAQGCTAVWIEARLACASILYVREIAQVFYMSFVMDDTLLYFDSIVL